MSAISGRNQQLKKFVSDVTATLLEGKRHRTDGFGTFSTCVRKAKAGHCGSKMAMFRASPELRAFSSGDSFPSITGPHVKAITQIVTSMQSKDGVEIPLLGRMAVVPVKGKKPKLIFHGAKELNDALADS